MSTPEFQQQFNVNESLIAKASGMSGHRDPKYDLDMIIPDLHGMTVIADCGHIVTEKEFGRNGGWCDRCVLNGR